MQSIFQHFPIIESPHIITNPIFTELKYDLLSSKLEGKSDTYVVLNSNKSSADILLTNLEFELRYAPQGKYKTSMFFILAVSHGTELFLTEPREPLNGKLIFTDKFRFKNLKDDFIIKAEVFYIKFKTEKTILETLFGKVSTFETEYKYIVFNDGSGKVPIESLYKQSSKHTVYNNIGNFFYSHQKQFEQFSNLFLSMKEYFDLLFATNFLPPHTNVLRVLLFDLACLLRLFSVLNIFISLFRYFTTCVPSISLYLVSTVV